MSGEGGYHSSSNSYLALQLGIQRLHHLGWSVIMKELFLIGHQPFQTSQLMNNDVTAANDKSAAKGTASQDTPTPLESKLLERVELQCLS